MLKYVLMIGSHDFSHALTWATASALFAFLLSFALTPIYTTLAYRYKAWKRVRDTAVSGEKAPVFYKLHAAKHRRNIPTMAGIIIVLAVSAVTLLTNLDRGQTYLPLFGLVAAGVVGLIDDYINIRGQDKGIAGLRSHIKFSLILLIAFLASYWAYFKLGYKSLELPYHGQLYLGLFIIPLFTFVIVGTANAVNITDGLDGLSGGLLSIAFGSFGVIALLQGHFAIAAFCATVVGSLLAYTWFNIYPARFFMGDTGSFALGTALAMVALLTDTVLLLPIIGGLFVIEAGSVLLQLFSKRVFKRKIFLSSPIHHHFEAIGWPETKVTMRFWVIGAIFAASGIAIAVAGGVIPK